MVGLFAFVALFAAGALFALGVVVMRLRGLRWLVMAFVALSMGLALLVFRHSQDVFYAFPVVYLFLIYFFALTYYGYRAFLGRGKPLTWTLFLPFFWVLLFVPFYYYEPMVGSRLFLFAAIVAGYSWFIARLLHRKSRLVYRRFVPFFLFIYYFNSALFLFFGGFALYFFSSVQDKGDSLLFSFLAWFSGYGIVFLVFHIAAVVLLLSDRIAMLNIHERKKLLSVFDSMDDLIYVTDPQNYALVYVNKKYLRYRQNSESKCYHAIYDRQNPCEYCNVPSMARAKGLGTWPEREVWDEKRQKWVSRKGRILPWRDGRRLFLQQETDITRRKKNDLMREEVEHVLRHDLKNPLTSMLSLAGLIEESDSGEISRYGQLLRKTSERMLEMIESYLDIHRMALGNYKVRREEISVDSLMTKVQNELEDLVQAKDLAIQLRKEPKDNGHGDCILYGEKVYLHNMFLNLLKNALEASPSGETVSLTFAEGEDCQVRINNKGVVPAEIRDRLFDKFVTSGKKSGTGLGSYSARIIARAHGGDINYETSGEEGTTIFIRLPAR